MPDLTLPQLEQRPSKPRSTRGKWRALVLLLVHVAIIAHIVHWQLAGDTITPVEPSETSHALRDGLINAGAIFFAVALLLTLLLGRFVCGWLCHLVALQDACSWMLNKVGIRPKPFRSRLVMLAPLALALYLFVWQPFAPRFFETGDLGPEGGFRTAFVDDGFWDTFPPLAIAIPFLLVCGFLTVYFLGAKGFCTYACPYGGFFAPLDRAAPVRIKVDADACEGSGHCTAVCTSNVRVHQEVADYGMVTDPGCMKCMDCINACPNDALSLGVAKPPLLKKLPKPQRGPRFLSWTEELVAGVTFLVVFLATFRAYGPNLFPLLFAGGVAACATPLGVALFNLFRADNLRLVRLQLKRAGAMTRAGVAFACFGALGVLLVGHTAFVNIQRVSVNAAFDDLGAPAQAFLTPNPPELDEDKRARLENAVARARTIEPFWNGGIALAYNERVAGRAAVMLMALGEREESERAFDAIEERAEPDDLITATRAALLLLENRVEEATTLLENRLDAHPEFWQAREVHNRVLVATGRLNDALERTDAALAGFDDSWKTREVRARTGAQLARLLASARQTERALEEIERAAETDPRIANVGELRAAFRLQLGRDPDGAIEEMTRVANIEPRDPGPWLRLAQLGAAVGRESVTRDAAERFLELRKDSDEARDLVAPLLNRSR
jgi:tetratricopeptide (TPR) repeat protein/ferredoxin